MILCSMLVEDVMKEEVITVSPDDTIGETAKKLAENNISGAPVVYNEKVIGVISESDILRTLQKNLIEKEVVIEPTPLGIFISQIKEKEKYDEVSKIFSEIEEITVYDVMSKDAITVGRKDTVKKASSLMIEKRINRIPVVEEGRLVGIITRGDIIKGLAEEGKVKSP